MIMGHVAVLLRGYDIGRAMNLITWQWEPDHCRIVADVGLTDEDRDAVNRIAAREGVDPVELEQALAATCISEVNVQSRSTAPKESQ